MFSLVSFCFGVSFAFTVIVLFTVAVFPFEFLTEYVIVYFPALDVFTVPDIVILLVISPSLSSLAVAPCSVYVSPTFRFILASPFKVIVGSSFLAGVSAFALLCSVQYVFGALDTEELMLFHNPSLSFSTR